MANSLLKKSHAKVAKDAKELLFRGLCVLRVLCVRHFRYFNRLLSGPPLDPVCDTPSPGWLRSCQGDIATAMPAAPADTKPDPNAAGKIPGRPFGTPFGRNESRIGPMRPHPGDSILISAKYFSNRPIPFSFVRKITPNGRSGFQTARPASQTPGTGRAGPAREFLLARKHARRLFCRPA